jgi:hypothetical protein
MIDDDILLSPPFSYSSYFQRVKVNVSGANGSYVLNAQAGAVSGRSGIVNTAGNLGGKDVVAVTTYGREGLTKSEAQREATLLRILQGDKGGFSANPWVQNIWFPSDTPKWPAPWAVIIKANPEPFEVDPDRPLNDSQQLAVKHMLSQEDEDRIVLIQGPPGKFYHLVYYVLREISFAVRDRQNQRHFLFRAESDQCRLHRNMAGRTKQRCSEKYC